MSAPDHLSVERRGPVAVLTIGRPAKRNAMSATMWAALPDVGDLLGGSDATDLMADVRRDELAMVRRHCIGGLDADELRQAAAEARRYRDMP